MSTSVAGRGDPHADEVLADTWLDHERQQGMMA
jgi:hypothetical protein